MSDERSVEARILGLLAFTNDLLDSTVDSSYPSDAGAFGYIKTSLQSAAEFSPKLELRRLARLALAISNRTYGSSVDHLAEEICMGVHDGISGLSPISDIPSLTRLLEEVEVFSRAAYHQGDQVEEYRRRLHAILDRREEITAQSTSYQTREIHSSALQIRYPPAILASEGPTYADVFSESVGPIGSNGINLSGLYHTSLFAYHLILLRLPTTFHSLASGAFPQNTDLCEDDLWDNFTEILLKQWKTLGLFATLVFGATLTMFQIPSVTASLLLQSLARCALLCVMMSLIQTSLLTIYFGGWTSSGTAASWVQEIQTANPYTFWNFWILIALPAVWTWEYSFSLHP
ncbi:hypothetical protein B0H16DRAFT_1522193 [Mycena metata]|uniref:Uncharacterized protein n=1 Tax=Mycena metata TaxID=1033252 RepID=A0AAD7JKB8_9AGAR|nr:hypothetical protein B0H16DRAFT_1522193 [Mycena metata]